MRRPFFIFILLLVGIVLCQPRAGRAQRGSIDEIMGSHRLENPTVAIEYAERRKWTIFGRVLAPSGEPVSGVKVVVDIGAAGESRHTLETNLQGEFSTEYILDIKLYKRLNVEAVATKEGCLEARETGQFALDEGTRGIFLVLREDVQDPDVLPLSGLIASLAPRFRTPDGGPASAAARKDFQRGADQLLDKHNAAKAVQSVAKVVEREPDCGACRSLHSLALLSAGSWVSATRQLAEAIKIGTPEKPGTARPEPFLILGVMESWRHEPQRAAGFLRRALEVQPEDPVVLHELGRVLLLQRDWEAAEQHLKKAISLGAPPEARLLRVRALLGAGDTEEAEAEMQAYLGGRQPKQLPAPARLVYTQLQDRLQLKAYGGTKSVVEQSVETLIQSVPELKDLQPAPSQEALAPLVERVGEGVAAFFRNLPNTVSLEDIRAEILRQDGKVTDSFDEKFNYLFLARPAKWGLGVDEYRTATGQNLAASTTPRDNYMRTAGFVCASLVFHPAYQAGATFRLLGTQVIDGKRTAVLAFAQRPEKAVPLAQFNVGRKSLPLLMQGIAWVDAETCRILRIRRDILNSPPKSRLDRLTTDIHYAEVQFKEFSTPLWLPHEVTVSVQWKGKAFRNRHRYSDFKVFKVEAEEKRKAAEVPPEVPREVN
jgi:tetratricopeptide (TPR) repeat protein